MTDRRFLEDYFDRYKRALFDTNVSDLLVQAAERVRQVKRENKKLLVVGNGGSASIAGHAALDFSKQGGVRSMSFASDALVTALSNDYGYERWVEAALELYADPGDVVVLISTSGRSSNILRAAQKALEMGLDIITFSGFAEDNPLKMAGGLSFWLESRAYNIVENTHQIWLLAICDLVIGQAEYSVS